MEKKVSLKITLTLMLFASALTCLILALTIGRELGMFTDRFGVVREYATLLQRIDEYFIGDFDLAEVSAESKRAAIRALGDRWSYYMTAEEFAASLARAANRSPGIGITAGIDEETGGMRVFSVLQDTPAMTAGLLGGDVILEIDGDDITHLRFEEMRTKLARPIGSTVELTVMREDGAIDVLTLLFSWIFRNPVSYEMLDDGIGYIAISNFDGESANNFIAAIESLIQQGAQGVVFDVRNNPGGRVAELTRILDHLLPEGEIFIAVDRDGEDIITSGPGMTEIYAVVLVNENSFSAAEYFAAMLREYEYAYIIGAQTTGKSRMQRAIELPGGSAIRLSTAEYLTKNRVSLYNEGGVIPDYPVDFTDEEFVALWHGTLENDDDSQLQKALSVLRGMMNQDS